MYFANEIEIYDNMSENFNHVLELSKDKKFKIPYMDHSLIKRSNIEIEGKIKPIYLSMWRSKGLRMIDNKQISIAIEERPSGYILMITRWIHSKPTTKFYELEEKPNWNIIEEYVKSDF